MSRHFLSRLWHQLDKCEKAKNKYARVHLGNLIINDLHLWLNFLDKAHKGISMNLLVFRDPNHVYCTDACEYGLGGIFQDGSIWRWEIPCNLLHRAHITLLEFMAMVAAYWNRLVWYMDVTQIMYMPIHQVESLEDKNIPGEFFALFWAHSGSERQSAHNTLQLLNDRTNMQTTLHDPS